VESESFERMYEEFEIALAPLIDFSVRWRDEMVSEDLLSEEQELRLKTLFEKLEHCLD
jgi:hypothetical protein